MNKPVSVTQQQNPAVLPQVNRQALPVVQATSTPVTQVSSAAKSFKSVDLVCKNKRTFFSLRKRKGA